jgi:GcrA cell cycle regulator
MWTEERSELLKKLWADGFSASQIAGRLGGITRNAVIGKVHRLGLATRPGTNLLCRPTRVPRVRVQRTERPRIVRMAACAAVEPVQYELPLFPITAVTSSAAPKQPPVIELTVPAPLRVNLLDLKECMCRWPIGDPHSSGFHFCGRQKAASGSYCEHHARIGTQPGGVENEETTSIAGCSGVTHEGACPYRARGVHGAQSKRRGSAREDRGAGIGNRDAA